MSAPRRPALPQRALPCHNLSSRVATHPPVSQRALPCHDAPSRVTAHSPPVSRRAPCNGHISHYKPITLSACYMTGIPVGYQDPVGILAIRFRSGHIDLQIRSGSDYLGLLDIPVRSRPERILEVIGSGPAFSGPESDRNRIYSGTLPSLRPASLRGAQFSILNRCIEV